MNAIAVGGGLAIGIVIALFIFYRMRWLRPQMAGYAAQRMCPSCGLITPRSKAACMECGKAFSTDKVA
jgi:predicted amidophosphoribosyltransferase